MAVWTELDVVTLIAWLDLSLGSLRNEVDFEKTIIDRLKESRRQHTGHEFKFTILQVRNKLIDLARKDPELKDGKSYPRLQEILSRGSHCFPGLAAELRQQVDETIEQLRKSYVRSQPKTVRQAAQPLGEQNMPKSGLPIDADCSDRHALEGHTMVRTCLNVVSCSFRIADRHLAEDHANVWSRQLLILLRGLLMKAGLGD
jgi:hypothetical protein